VTASFDLPVASLPGSASIGLLVKARQGGSNVSLLLGAPAYASKVTVNLLEPPPLAPYVSAGKDFTGHVAEVVHLDGRGNDPEGTALLFEWDFDGDGQFDYSGATGKVDHIYQSAGTFRSVLRARDTSGLFGRSSVQLTIKDRNRPPVIQGGSPAGAVVVQEGEVQQFRVQAQDPDGDRLAYSWYLDGELLGGASSESYIFRATRDNIGDRGLMVTVSDGLAGTSYSWSFRVVGRNHPPSIDAHQPVDHSLSLVEGDLQRFTVAATDPDGDRLAYEWMLDADRVSSGPDFLYAPDSSSDGAHNVTVTVTDGRLNSSTGWSVRVSDLNRAPRVTLLGPPDGSVFPYGGEIFFEARASDPDGDVLGFRWSSDISGVIGTGNGITRVLSPGVHHVRLTVSDGKTETVAEATITVKGRPAGPEKAPGMEAAVLAPALVAVIALTACRRRRR